MEWLPYRLVYYALFVIIVFYFYQIFDIQYVRRFPQSKWVYRSIMVVLSGGMDGFWVRRESDVFKNTGVYWQHSDFGGDAV